jgi:pyruvate dehydrogenase E2 component (dihydrolipoyllysine-residue acetyltransferase)
VRPAGAVEFTLPDVGEGIDGAEIIEWRVGVGDRVQEDQELVEVQTDKAIVVIPSPATGTVTAIGAPEGERLAVGAVLAVIERDGGNGAAPEPAPPPPAASRALASPATRRRARELGVDLAAVEGSGPHGRIVREDVERAATPEPAASEPPAAPTRSRSGEVIPLRGVRRAIAHTLTRAWQEIPHIIDYREVDATRLLAARAALRGRAAERGEEALARALTPTPLIAAAALRALPDHPYVNASVDLEREEITLHAHVHLGVATATPDGLMVPVVRDADRRTVAELALAIAELSRAARERRLAPEQLRGATFTVNNFGGLGVWLGTPIIQPPQVVNFGVGAIRERVVAIDGAPQVRPVCALAVSGDHRVLDGDTLGAFVSQVVTLLEEPVLIFDGGG